MSEKMEDKIRQVLEEKVNPALMGHFGSAELTGVEDGVAYIKFLGECGRCPSAEITMEEFVKVVLLDSVEGLKDVVLDNSVSDELLDFARQILSKEE